MMAAKEKNLVEKWKLSGSPSKISKSLLISAS